jgi:hypothetical protein
MTYPLHVELSLPTILIDPVAVDTLLVDRVKLSRVVVEICLAKCPSPCDRKLVEVVLDTQESAVRRLERVWNLAGPA